MSVLLSMRKNARTPNAETTAKLAEVLKVSPVVFSPTICASREDLLQSMYWLFLMKGGGDIYDCETEYARSRMEQKLGVITVEEFLEKDSRKLSLPSGFDAGSTEGFFYSQNNFKILGRKILWHFFNSAVTVLQTLVIALGAGLGI